MDDERNIKELLMLFTFDRKKDLEAFTRDAVIHSWAFAALIKACHDVPDFAFRHKIHYRDIVPPHLLPTEENTSPLNGHPVGPMTPAARKVARRIFQLFEDRRYFVGHIFFRPQEWHLIAFDQRDLAQRRNHWEHGPHVHFINWLWPNLDAPAVWADVVTNNRRPRGSLHVRYREPEHEEVLPRGDRPPLRNRASTINIGRRR